LTNYDKAIFLEDGKTVSSFKFGKIE